LDIYFVTFLQRFTFQVKPQVRACRPQGYQSYVGRYTDTQTHTYLKTWGQTFCLAMLLFKLLADSALAARKTRAEQCYLLAWR
jgi:hypothetical protein